MQTFGNSSTASAADSGNMQPDITSLPDDADTTPDHRDETEQTQHVSTGKDALPETEPCFTVS